MPRCALLQTHVCTLCEQGLVKEEVDVKLVGILKYHVCPSCRQQVLEVDQTSEYKKRFWQWIAKNGVPR